MWHTIENNSHINNSSPVLLLSTKTKSLCSLFENVLFNVFKCLCTSVQFWYNSIPELYYCHKFEKQNPYIQTSKLICLIELFIPTGFFPLKSELLGFTWHFLHHSRIWIEGFDGLIPGLAREQLGPGLVYLKGPSQTHYDKACTVQYRTVANIPLLRKQEALWFPLIHRAKGGDPCLLWRETRSVKANFS